MSDPIGKSFGRYHILEQLGEGGMAIVYKAFDTRLEADVAVKVIRTENILPSILDRALKRFEREAKALARLTHPNIVKVTDYGENEGKPYLVMPYLPGGTLKAKMGSPIPWQEAVQLLLPIAQALDYAHSQNMIHRDVKPSNIIFTEQGWPMLTDFGIAKVLDLDETIDLTGTSAAVGTPEYMAPEQATAKTVDHRADIYALGIVLYEMVTGRKPFMADTPLAVLFKHVSDPLPSPSKYVPDLPLEVEKFLVKALAKKPEDRYQSMKEMTQGFERLLNSTRQPAKREKPVTKNAVQPGQKITKPTYGNVALQEKNTTPTLKWFLFGFPVLLFVLLLGVWGGSKFLSNRDVPSVGTTFTELPTSLPIATAISATATSVPVMPTMSIQHGTLRVNASDFPQTLDPQKAASSNEIGHLSKIYEGLTKVTSDLETIPAAAESWTYNEDATVLTFTLHDNLVYSDGSVLNAERFAYSIKRVIDPDTAAEYASIFLEIKGAEEWNSGDKAASTIVDDSVKASGADGSPCTGYEDLDCNTLTLTFSRPAPYFHTVVSTWLAYPAKQENIEKGDSWWSSPELQIGNGGWILRALDQDNGSEFLVNTKYHAEVPYYDIKFLYIADLAKALDAYQNNDLDITASPDEEFAAIEADPSLKAQHLTYPYGCTLVVKFNMNPTWNGRTNPFTDKKVREAFALAFDAEGWVRDVDGGLSSPTWTWVPLGFPGYDSKTPLKYDVDAARAALAESSFGGPDGLNALNLKLTYGDTPRNRQRSEWLVANYMKNLGVDIALDPVDTGTFSNLLKDPKTYPLMARQGWCADYPDLYSWFNAYWHSDTISAFRQGYANLDFDSLLDQAVNGYIPSNERVELYRQAQQVLLADFPAAFGYNTLNHYLVKPWVKGIQPTPQDWIFPGDMSPTSIYIDVSMLP